MIATVLSLPWLKPEDKVPDTKTIWVYRKRLKELGLVEALFSERLRQLDAAGFTARKGQIIVAAIVPAPKQRNTWEENVQIKAGDAPEQWSGHKRYQKDLEARWTRTHGKTYNAYKNHISVDRQHKVIRNYAVNGH